jgi:hypothetical protein
MFVAMYPDAATHQTHTEALDLHLEGIAQLALNPSSHTTKMRSIQAACWKSQNPNMSHSFFHRQQKVPAAVAAVEAAQVIDTNNIDTSILTSSDPNIVAFYAQLSPKERIAHTIAIDKLGTSYDVIRTHAYTKWLKQRTQ